MTCWLKNVFSFSVNSGSGPPSRIWSGYCCWNSYWRTITSEKVYWWRKSAYVVGSSGFLLKLQTNPAILALIAFCTLYKCWEFLGFFSGFTKWPTTFCLCQCEAKVPNGRNFYQGNVHKHISCGSWILVSHKHIHVAVLIIISKMQMKIVKLKVLGLEVVILISDTAIKFEWNFSLWF